MDGNFYNFKAIGMSIYIKENIYLYQRKNVPLYSVCGDTESDRVGVNKCTLYRSVFIGIMLGLEIQHPVEGSNPQLVVSVACVTWLIFISRKPR